MFDFRGAQLNCLFWLMYWLLTVTALLYFFSYPEADNDLWGHLFFGRAIWEEQTIPRENRYSYTAPDHPWINHEWLAELLLYGAYALMGSPGLVFLKLAVAGGVILILDRIVRQKISSPAVRIITLIWVMSIIAPGFNARPQIFTYLFFALTLLVLHRCAGGKEKALYALFPVMALWVNLHGGFIAGLGAIGVFGLKALICQPYAAKRAHFWGALGFLLSGLLVNPFGMNLLLFLWRDLTMARRITEWLPLPLSSLSSIDFKIAVLFVLGFVITKRLWGRWETILALLAAVFAFWQQRHTPLFGIAAAPLLAQGIDDLRAWLEENSSAMTLLMRRWFGWVVYGFIGYQLVWIGQTHWQHRWRVVISPFEFPTQAADFLIRNQIRGNLVVPFDWGEYFIWKFHPQSRVSIDGRYTTAYPLEVIRDSWAWMEGKDGWERVLDLYPSEIAITNRHHPVTALLRSDPEWVYIYSDPIAFVFVRKVSAQEALLTKFTERKLVPPQPPPLYFPG